MVIAELYSKTNNNEKYIMILPLNWYIIWNFFLEMGEDVIQKLWKLCLHSISVWNTCNTAWFSELLPKFVFLHALIPSTVINCWEGWNDLEINPFSYSGHWFLKTHFSYAICFIFFVLLVNGTWIWEINLFFFSLKWKQSVEVEVKVEQFYILKVHRPSKQRDNSSYD